MNDMPIIMLALVLFTAALSPARAADPKAKVIPDAVARQVVAHYTQTVRESYADAVAAAHALRVAVDSFARAPGEDSLRAAREAWKKARDAYSPTEAFRFYGGPIDHPQTGPEALINAWPIDEAYLDYVQGNAQAGIINHPREYPQITKELLVSLNEKGGEKNVSTGFHAVEFLLWGQDRSAKGPGERPYTDYVVDKTPHAARRAQTLRLLAELLESDLTRVAEQWKPGAANDYSAELSGAPLAESLRRIYTGVVSLSIDEMAGERMTVPLEKSDQENEQDCFSDYTARDLASNQAGIRRVYYGDAKGPGLEAVVKAIDPRLAARTDARLKATDRAIAALQKQSFDRVIAAKESSTDRKAARRAIAALEEQARTLAKSGLEMDLPLNIQ
jgi:putative iron-regulated protein